MSQRRRDYCFTINNPNEEDIESLANLEASSKVRYMVVGEETGEQGTDHYQGYIYFHNAIAFDPLKKLLPRAHIEPCLGSPQQNIDYCTKGKRFREHGERPMSQKRKGELGREYWDEQLSLAKKGRVEECDSKLQITHFNSLNAISARYSPMPPDNDQCSNEWYYGATGTGKSRKARSENPGCYLKMCNKWWDGYLGEETVLIEDFDKKHDVLGHHLKIWADRYAFPAEVKGSKVNLRPKRIIVTSNWHPNEIWQDLQTLEPIERRFKIIKFSLFPYSPTNNCERT